MGSGDDGLYVWHDQMESGADNLVTSRCPSKVAFWCWNEAKDADTLASVDLQLFLAREHEAYALFLRSWSQKSSTAAQAAR
eukprot:162086-Prymnesium_polylepis.1